MRPKQRPVQIPFYYYILITILALKTLTTLRESSQAFVLSLEASRHRAALIHLEARHREYRQQLATKNSLVSVRLAKQYADFVPIYKVIYLEGSNE